MKTLKFQRVYLRARLTEPGVQSHRKDRVRQFRLVIPAEAVAEPVASEATDGRPLEELSPEVVGASAELVWPSTL